VIYTDYDGSFMNKAQFMASVKAPSLHPEQIVNESMAAQVYGDSAVVTGVYRERSINNGKTYLSAVVTVPIYHSVTNVNLCPGGTCTGTGTIVGFLQVAITQNVAGGPNGQVAGVIMNAAGCNPAAGNPAVSGGGVSPISVRLIHQCRVRAVEWAPLSPRQTDRLKVHVGTNSNALALTDPPTHAYFQ
jgi:hypothetical protein